MNGRILLLQAHDILICHGLDRICNKKRVTLSIGHEAFGS